MDILKDLIHIAMITRKNLAHPYLFLRKVDPHTFSWFHADADGKNEKATPVSADNIEEAIRLANREWKIDYFRTLNCGFRYTLPERDEHGINALFHQMVSSYSSSNGIYYDQELGANCIVQNASIEARNLWNKLRSNG